MILSFDKSDLPDCRCRVEASLPVGGVPSPRNQRCFPASLSFPNLYIRCHVSWCDFQFYNILYFHDCSLPFSTFISEFYKSYLSSFFIDASPILKERMSQSLCSTKNMKTVRPLSELDLREVKKGKIKSAKS